MTPHWRRNVVNLTRSLGIVRTGRAVWQYEWVLPARWVPKTCRHLHRRDGDRVNPLLLTLVAFVRIRLTSSTAATTVCDPGDGRRMPFFDF